MPTLLDRCAALVAAAGDVRRAVLGITGPPGAGKTTLVLDLLRAAQADARLAGRVAHVPMDGYHRTNEELRRLGRLDRKGAPDTFDAAAYAELLRAAREVPRRELAAPSFDHAVGEPAPGTIPVPVEADLVVTEGNYLLLDDVDWTPVHEQLDEVWFCMIADTVRQGRLVARHIEAGRAPQDATEWVLRSDEANARLVATTHAGADVVLVDGRIL